MGLRYYNASSPILKMKGSCGHITGSSNTQRVEPCSESCRRQRSSKFPALQRSQLSSSRHHARLENNGTLNPRKNPSRANSCVLAAATTVAERPKRVLAQETLSKQRYDAGIEIRVSRGADAYTVDVMADPVRPMVLHWAVNEWQLPPQDSWPSGTNQMDEKAVQTPFDGSGRVHISFPAKSCPSRVVFVLKETEPEAWLNSGAGDFVAQLKPPDLSNLVDKVITAESTYTHWSLFNRFCMANDILDAADAAGGAGMALIYVWLRLSTMKQLDWHRGSSYQSKDIAHAQKTIAQRMADKARGSSDPMAQQLARMTLAGLPRGGGDGDAIRHGILNVMRENGIREGHRPGIEDKFLEQWHQKLHTNTTPADITICEAYIDFLHSGDGGHFWHALWEKGGLTKDALATMDHPITATPLHLPHLIGPMQHYLWILKTTHSGADMDTSMEMAKGSLDDSLRWTLYDILKNRNEWWVPGKIVEAREQLQHFWKVHPTDIPFAKPVTSHKREGASRDVLLLDIALDNYFRLCLERTDKAALPADDLCELIELVLRNTVIAYNSHDFRQCRAVWERVRGEERWSKPWAMRALAAAQRLELSLGAFADSLYSLTQPLAERFRDSCGVDPAYVTNFGEEVARGQPVFIMGQLLKCLEPTLRETAEVAPWQVVSQADAQGRVRVVALSEIQGQRFEQPAIVIAETVGGMEDIPENVTAVLTASTTDVLSHVAIRARSQKVLLATCFEDAQLEDLKALEGQYVRLDRDPLGNVSATTMDVSEVSSNGASSNGAGKLPPLDIPKPKASKKWALQETEFDSGLVGGKSSNLAILRTKVTGGVSVPDSVALPFGSFERVLEDPCNSDAALGISACMEDLKNEARQKGGVPLALAQLRHLVRRTLQAPAALVEEAASAAEAAGLVEAGAWTEESPAWESAWSAICQVWASKWSERAWLSRRARHVPDGSLYMAVLLQQVVPAEYAFVLHTANPITGARGQVFGELVHGMGEALVGNHPGRALSFKAGTGGVEILALPAKRVGFFAMDGTLIARSDSNGEDLEAFAGAGLYDSVPLPALREETLDAASSPLLWDTKALQSMLSEIVEVGRSTEAAFGGAPQDIEGVWANGKITIVQSRAQVL